MAAKPLKVKLEKLISSPLIVIVDVPSPEAARPDKATSDVPAPGVVRVPVRLRLAWVKLKIGLGAEKVIADPLGVDAVPFDWPVKAKVPFRKL